MQTYLIGGRSRALGSTAIPRAPSSIVVAPPRYLLPSSNDDTRLRFAIAENRTKHIIDALDTYTRTEKRSLSLRGTVSVKIVRGIWRMRDRVGDAIRRAIVTRFLPTL